MGASVTGALRDYIIGELAAPHLPVVPFAPGIDQTALTAGDDAPLFVTLPIAKVGRSRNGRYYDAAVVAEIAEQVNRDRPGGIMGHIAEAERATRYDRPEVIWLGATVAGDTAYGKGYIPPYARDTRDFLRRAKAAGHQVATSIYGRWQQAHDAALGAVKVLAGGTLESIDFAPAARAGMAFDGGFALSAEMTAAQTDALAGTIAPALRREMKGAEPGASVNVRVAASSRVATDPAGAGAEPIVVSVESASERYDEGGSTVNRSEVIQTLTVAEMAQLPQAVRDHLQAEQRAAVAEQLGPVRQELGLAEDAPVAKVVTTVSELVAARREAERRDAQAAVDAHLDGQLAERVAKEAPPEAAAKARATVRRLVVAEMGAERTVAGADRALGAVLGDETVAEMVATLVRVAPTGGAPTIVSRDDARLTARHGTGESKFARTKRDY